VLTRAAQLFKNDEVKIREFQSWVSRYNRDTATALELVDSVATFSGAGPDDTPSSEAGTFIRELAELFEARSKGEDLMAAWHDRRTRNEVDAYPTLPAGAPAPTAGAAGGPAWHAGARVLRLKSATAQSSRSPVGRTAAWGSAAAGGGGKAGNSGSSSGGASSSSPWTTGPGAPTAFTGAATTTASGGGAAPRPTAGGKTAAAALGGGRGGGALRRAGLADAAAFPALPAAQAPASAGFTVFTPGSAGGRVVRRDIGRGTAANAWDSSAVRGSGNGNASATADADDEGAPGKAKKSGRKKQTLMHFG
jgi:E3 ubiquitin-protein ligase ZNF598